MTEDETRKLRPVMTFRVQSQDGTIDVAVDADSESSAVAKVAIHVIRLKATPVSAAHNQRL